LAAFNGKGSIFQPDRKLPVPVVKRIARQLLHALNFLHQECGIIHTGQIFFAYVPSLSQALIAPEDLKPDNIPYYASKCRRSHSTAHYWPIDIDKASNA
jgi:serine/threonine protein kinase